MNFSGKTQKIVIGAAVFLGVFYVARKGFLGMDAQAYATDLSTRTIIEGVNF